MVESTYKEIFRIALPSIVANITVPLLSLVGVAIVGHLGETAYIGSIAVAGILFNMVYWLFGFLRMGTSGLTAQSFGKEDFHQCRAHLLRSLSIGIVAGLLLILLQKPILSTALYFIEASEEVEKYASLYFQICIWGAPATLGLYSLNGWFIGMQNSRLPMFISIFQNLVNIGMSLLMVFVFHWKIEGVAIGALSAQYTGFFLALFATERVMPIWNSLRVQDFWDKGEFYHFLSINKDIFFRTLCIISVTVYFTSTGAMYGDTILAVNTLLMQLFTLYSYIMDGFAYAGEAIVGKHYGAQNFTAMRATIRKLFALSAVACGAFTLLYAMGGEGFLGLLTNDKAVITASADYFAWALLIPVMGMSAFILDGISVGITATRSMLLSLLWASALFFTLYLSTQTLWGNHALWLSFLSYLCVRGIILGILLKSRLSRNNP